MKNKQIFNTKAWLALCLFFALLSVLPVYGSEWRLTLTPDELDKKTADEVATMLQKATNDTDKLKLNFFLATKIRLSNLDSALSNIEQVYLLREKTSYYSWDVYIERTAGLIYAAKGDWDKAMQHYTKGVALAEKRKDSVEVAKILRYIGNVLQHQNQPAKAKEYYSRSLLFHNPELHGDKLLEMRKMSKQGKHAEVIAFIKKTLPKIKKEENVLFLLQAFGNIGFEYNYLDQIDSATFYLARAEKIAHKIGHNKMLASIYIHKGIIMQKKGNYTLALELYKKALRYGKKSNSLSTVKNNYQYLAAIYDTLGNYKLAKAYQDSFIIFSDSVNVVSNAKKIAEVEANYQTARKDQQIAEEAKKRQQAEAEIRQTTLLLFGALGLLIAFLLVAFFYARQRKAKEHQRNAELEQKALRAQMNPHFIFNSLNAIQKLYLESDFEQADEYMGDFGQLLRKILENSGRELITLHEEMETLDLYMRLEQSRMPGRLQYELNMNEQLDKHHIMVPPLILQPICENAIWHGIVPKEKGKVTINIQQSGNNKLLECTIMDNGVGMDATIGKSQHNSKGLNLVKQRLGSRGSLRIINLTEGGTQVVMLIPCKI